MFEDNEKELLEYLPENNSIDPEKALRRVKYYQLNENKIWEDLGTGYVSLSEAVNNINLLY